MTVPFRARWRSKALMSSYRCSQIFRGHQLGGQPLLVEQLRVDADHQHFLVVRPVEDADRAALGKLAVTRHRKSWASSAGTGALKRRHRRPLRVEAAHDVLDDAVLAGGVHGLEHEQQRPALLGVEEFLQGGTGGRYPARGGRPPGPSRRRAACRPGSNRRRRTFEPGSTRNRSALTFIACLPTRRAVSPARDFVGQRGRRPKRLRRGCEPASRSRPRSPRQPGSSAARPRRSGRPRPSGRPTSGASRRRRRSRR